MEGDDKNLSWFFPKKLLVIADWSKRIISGDFLAIIFLTTLV